MKIRSSIEKEQESTSRHRLLFVADLDQNASQAGLWQASTETPPQTKLKLYQALHRAIAESLTPKQQEAIQLYFFEGLSQSQIARELGVSQQVINKRIYGTQRNGNLVGGALRKLRQALSTSLPEEHKWLLTV